MKDIWLIRHAESAANAGETTTTPREIPLSQEGELQANELAECLIERPDLVVLSPYDRAVQTARPLLQLYPDVTVETMNVQEFTYLSIERCRGTSHADRKPFVAEYWGRCDPFYSDGGQAESFAEFIGRCRDFLRQLRERQFELAFVYTHEQFIKGLLWDAVSGLGAIDKEAMSSFSNFMVSFSVPNASVLRCNTGVDGGFYFGSVDAVLSKDHA